MESPRGFEALNILQRKLEMKIFALRINKKNDRRHLGAGCIPTPHPDYMPPISMCLVRMSAGGGHLRLSGPLSRTA